MPSLPTFTPPRNPDVNAQFAEQPDLYLVRFGDGYSQRSPKGINSITGRLQLNWGMVTTAQKDTLVSFFQGRGGYLGFYYQLPGESVARKWICPQWSWSPVSFGIYAVEASFQQIFDPDP